MRNDREKNFDKIENMQDRFKALKHLYQNPMVFTEETAREEKRNLDKLREELNEVFVDTYAYIDDYTINNNTYRGKMLDMVKMSITKYNDLGSQGDIEQSYKYLDEHNSMLDAIDNLTNENKEWLEGKYIEYMQRPIDMESNAVAVIGYKLVNAYGEDLNNPAYIKLVKRLFKQFSVMANEGIRTFYVLMNKGTSICALLALHHIKKKYDDVKVVCVEEYENVSRQYPREIRGIYKQAMGIADRFVYIEEELNIRPFGVMTEQKSIAMQDWVLSKTSKTVAIYTLGSKEACIEQYLDKAKMHKHVINYVEV